MDPQTEARLREVERIQREQERELARLRERVIQLEQQLREKRVVI